MTKGNRKFIVETLFLKESLKHNISLNEFLVLMYFDNDDEMIFDVKKVSKAICLSEKDVLSAFGSLLDKKLISLNSVKNDNGQLIDKVSMESLYDVINSDTKIKEKDAKKQDFFSKFQEIFGHSLSGMDYELINAWLEHDFTEEMVLGALEEAKYNGVLTLRYIERILYEWQKKGFKTMQDVSNGLKKKSESINDDKLFETTVLEYNWLDEE